MLKIYLARHGQDIDNAQGILNGHRDQPLTEIGLEQAKEAAQNIKSAGLTFDQIYSSPLQRAYTTAQIMADALGNAAPQTLQALIERDFGVMSGRPVSAVAQECIPDILETPTITYFLHPEGAESFPMLLQRTRRLLAQLEQQHSTGSVLLVTHGDTGKMIYVAYYQLDWQRVLQDFHFGNGDLLLLSPDSPAEQAHVFKQEQVNS